MMNQILITGEIDENTYGRFIRELDTIDGSAMPLYLRIDSPGGSTAYAGSMAMATPLVHTLEIVSQCCSAAFMFARAITFKRLIVNPYAEVMVHLPRNDATVYSNGNFSDSVNLNYQECIKSKRATNHKMVLEMMQPIMSKKEYNEFCQAKDIFFTTQRAVTALLAPKSDADWRFSGVIRNASKQNTAARK